MNRSRCCANAKENLFYHELPIPGPVCNHGRVRTIQPVEHILGYEARCNLIAQPSEWCGERMSKVYGEQSMMLGLAPTSAHCSAPPQGHSRKKKGIFGVAGVLKYLRFSNCTCDIVSWYAYTSFSYDVFVLEYAQSCWEQRWNDTDKTLKSGLLQTAFHNRSQRETQVIRLCQQSSRRASIKIQINEQWSRGNQQRWQYKHWLE